MKITPLFRPLALACFSLHLSAFSLSAAAALPVESQLTAATVYADRAVVTRTAELDSLAEGEHELTFENLPSALMDDSLQVTAHGTAQATILDVNARNTFLEAQPDPRVKELEDQLKALAREHRGYDDRATILSQQRDFLLKIQTAATTPVSGTKDVPITRPGLDDWTKLLAFSEDNLRKLNTESEDLDIKRDDLQAKQTALEQQLNQLRNGGPSVSGGVRPAPVRNRNVKTVTVRLAVTSPGHLSLALAYGVRGASWAPSYDARLHTGADKPAVELSYFGNVRQNTGEDWKGIALTLSTARPSLGGGAPELRPWVLDEVPQVSAMAVGTALGSSPGSANTGGLMQNFAMSNAGMSNTLMVNGANTYTGGTTVNGGSLVMDKDASYAAAAVESGVTSASYKIAGTSTVLSDNTPQKVGITTGQFPARLQYQAVPRTLEAAFLSAYVTNTGEFPFLGGPMNTFLDDTFIAASSLKTVMPGEKFNLALGADEGIAVKRRLVNRVNEQTGFTNSGVRVTYEFLVTVTNNKKTQERFVFKELLPVSRNEKIVVTLLAPAERDLLTLAQVASDGEFPKPGITKEEDGKLVWRVDLKPGEKREFPLKFTVEYPQDFPITGLE